MVDGKQTEEQRSTWPPVVAVGRGGNARVHASDAHVHASDCTRARQRCTRAPTPTSRRPQLYMEGVSGVLHKPLRFSNSVGINISSGCACVCLCVCVCVYLQPTLL